MFQTTERANADLTFEDSRFREIYREVMGGIDCRYVQNVTTGVVRLVLIPEGMEVVSHRAHIEGREYAFGAPAWCSPWARECESLVLLRCSGDPLPSGYALGATCRDSGELRWSLVGIRTESGADFVAVVARLKASNGLVVVHTLRCIQGTQALTSETTVINDSGEVRTLELVSAVSIDGISPFAHDDALGRLWLHRARSFWSAEAQWESRSIEELGLERSWQGHAVRTERFGQVGSMPVRGWFPSAVLEDRRAGVSWGLSMEASGSWQMDVYRRGDDVAVSAGPADSDFGHWRKTLAPGEAFSAPVAYTAVCRGGLDDVCERLLKCSLARRVDGWSEGEEDLPIVFNEFCASWGEPCEASLDGLAQVLQGLGVRYFVIDAGWYADPGVSWLGSHGDWIPSAKRFPSGLASVAKKLRGKGYVPGIWLEPETVGIQAASHVREDEMLQQGGRVIKIGGRLFWDFRKPEVFDRILQQVISLVRDNDFGYVKFDYNETLGVGVDGAESPGEGLRQHIEAVEHFYRELRRALPDVVFEICSSGGHRLSPSFLNLCDMGSFSDAHESDCISLIAAAQHRLVHPRQLQIWAVLRPEFSCDETRRVLVNAFLGRMCLSGALQNLNADQWSVVKEALALYRAAVPVIREGFTTVYSAPGSGLRHRTGGQVVVRVSSAGDAVLIVATGFGAGAVSREAVLPAPGADKRWRVSGTMHGMRDKLHLDGTALRVVLSDVGMAGVWLLEAVPIKVEGEAPSPTVWRGVTRSRETVGV